MGLLLLPGHDALPIEIGIKDHSYDTCDVYKNLGLQTGIASTPFSNERSTSSTSASIQSQTSISSEDSSSSADPRSCIAVVGDQSGFLSQSTSLGSLPSLTRTSSILSTFPAGCHANHQYEHPSRECEYHECVATINLLHAHVSSLVCSGDYLYGGSSSTSNIYVWSKEELNKGRIAHIDVCKGARLGGNIGGVRALAAVGIDKVVSAHDGDNSIRVWKKSSTPAQTNALLQSRAQPAAPVLLENHISFKLLTTLPTLKDYLRTFLQGRNYDQVRRHHKRLWIEHVDAISALAVSKDSKLLYSASWDRSIKVWRLPDFKCLESVRKAHDDAINCLVVSQDGSFLYTGSADAKIKVWGAMPQAGRSVSVHHVHGNIIEGSSSVKSIRLAHSKVSTLEGHKSAVNALATSPDGSVLYSGAGDKAIIVWEREESAQHMVIAGALRGHRQAVLCLATVKHDDNDDEDRQCHMLCSGSADKTIRIWKRSICNDQNHETSAKPPALLELVQYKYYCVGVLEGHSGPVKCLSVSMASSRDHLSLYSASLDKTVKIWRLLHRSLKTLTNLEASHYK